MRKAFWAVLLWQAVALSAMAGAKNFVTTDTGKLRGSTQSGITSLKGFFSQDCPSVSFAGILRSRCKP